MGEQAIDFSKAPVLKVLAALGSDPKQGLVSAEAASRLAKFGPNALEEKKTSQWAVLFGFFWGPIPWMIEAAALMAAIVQDWGDFSIILALLAFNASLGFYEEHQASNALAALKNALALKAKVLRGGAWSEIAAQNIVPGDIIKIRLGDIVPADARLISGAFLSVDQAALTGESLPVAKKEGDLVYSGSIAKQGEMEAVVIATGGATFFGRTAKLVQKAGAASHFQAAVMRIGDFLIAIAAVLAVVLVAVQLSRGVSVLRLAEFVLILLVASVPVAMPAVLSMTMALGAKLLAREKAIVSRLESIEEMAGMEVLCSDKTGTLTQNKLTLGEVSPWGQTDPQAVLLAAALASKAEDEDPIDLAVLAGLRDRTVLTPFKPKAYQPFDPVTKRTEATLEDADGTIFRVAKGAPQVILALAKVTGDELEAANKRVDAFAAKGFRTLGVARAEASENWRFLGFIPLYDPPRVDSKETISRAEAYGVKVKMVTGDDVAIARQIAGELGLGVNIQLATDLFAGDVTKTGISPDIAAHIDAADGFARVFPEHKYAIVKALQERGKIVGMTGDGVNDAIRGQAACRADVPVLGHGARAGRTGVPAGLRGGHQRRPARLGHAEPGPRPGFRHGAADDARAGRRVGRADLRAGAEERRRLRAAGARSRGRRGVLARCLIRCRPGVVPNSAQPPRRPVSPQGVRAAAAAWRDRGVGGSIRPRPPAAPDPHRGGHRRRRSRPLPGRATGYPVGIQADPGGQGSLVRDAAQRRRQPALVAAVARRPPQQEQHQADDDDRPQPVLTRHA